MQSRRVVDEGPRLRAVELLEVLGSNVERLPYPLADRDGWHDHDVLRPPVALVQLHDRLRVDVRLARAGLHRYVKVEWRGRNLDRVLEILRQRQPTCLLDAVHVGEQLARRQGNLSVAQTRILHQGRRGVDARVDAVLHPVREGLAGEYVDHGLDGFALILLDLELQSDRPYLCLG